MISEQVRIQKNTVVLQLACVFVRQSAALRTEHK